MPPLFKSHNIKTRILRIFILLGLFVVVPVVVLTFKAGTIDDHLTYISSYSMARLRTLLEIGKSSIAIERSIHAFTQDQTGGENMKDLLAQEMAAIDQKEMEYQRLVRQDAETGSQIKPLALEIQGNKVAVKESVLEIIRIMNDPDGQFEGLASQHLTFDQVQRNFQVSLINAREGEFRLLSGLVDTLRASNGDVTRLTFFFGGVFLLLFILSGVSIYGSVIRPILHLRNAVTKFAQGQGDLDIDLKLGGEVGELAGSFSQMAAKLKESYAKLQEQTTALAQRYEGMSQQNKDLQDTKKAMLAVLEDARELEDKLAQEKNNLQAILASMNEPLFVTDQHRNLVMFNRAFERLAGLPRDQILKLKHIDQILKIHQNGIEMSIESRPTTIVLKTGRSFSLGIEDNISLITLAGKKIAVAIQTAPLIKENVTIGTVVVIRDISREKQLDEAKTGFISVASHQLRTPLTSMRWFSEMLMNGDAGPITDEQKHFVERVYQGTDRMIALVNLLLQIARVEAGRLKVEPVPLDLKSTTQGVILTLRSNLENKKQKVEVTCNPDPLPMIPADQEVIWQCVQNLLSNASRYGPENSTIFVNIVQKDGMLEYSVKDTGIGIPKEQQSRIFEKFFRAENALKAVPEGSGLGLSLVKSLVEGWGGKVWFEAEENKGTTFFFTIPLTGMKAKEGEVRLAV